MACRSAMPFTRQGAVRGAEARPTRIATPVLLFFRGFDVSRDEASFPVPLANARRRARRSRYRFDSYFRRKDTTFLDVADAIPTGTKLPRCRRAYFAS